MTPPPFFVRAALLAGVIASVAGVLRAASADTATPAASTPAAATPTITGAKSLSSADTSLLDQFDVLKTKIQSKLSLGQHSELDFAAELKEFDTILAPHMSEKSNIVAAQILISEAALYAEIFNDTDKALALLDQAKTSFTDTPYAADIDKISAQFKQMGAAAKIKSQLAVGATFPDFSVKDLDGQPLSVAGQKAKVVLVDFWAVWCGPCVAEMPNVIAAYDKYHKDGFQIVGVSLDTDKKQLQDYMATNKITWPQFYDGKEWQNELSTKYGIDSIPPNFLLDANGKILAKDLRGDALAKAVGDALAAGSKATATK